MNKLSIIIPVYNVEKYIDKCLSSCVNQNLTKFDYEIVVVNDGTKDNSLSVVFDYMKMYSFIHLINKENGGLSSARNEGLKHCTGEYVWFIDSDDTIAINSLELIERSIMEFSPDVLFFDITKVDETTAFSSYKKMYSSACEVTKTGVEWLRIGDDIWPMAQMYVFKKDFFDNHKLFFKEGILHEDVEFKFRFMSVAERVTYIPNSIYNYLLRSSGSISSGYNVKRVFDLRDIVLSEIDYIKTFASQYQPSMFYACYRNFENYIAFVVNNKVPEETSRTKDVYDRIKPFLWKALKVSSTRYRPKILLSIISLTLLKGFINIRK